jgi:isocitrate dehydrogenase
MQSLRAQGKQEQAVMIEKRFQKAWNQSDVTLTASRFMGETRTTVATSETGVFGN